MTQQKWEQIDMGVSHRHLQPSMSFDQIAAELGITRQVAHIYYRRGMAKLRKYGGKEAAELVALIDQRRSYAEATGDRRRAARGNA
jgi:predicted DNA-binding protein YlxM (UPF0122 family)